VLLTASLNKPQKRLIHSPANIRATLYFSPHHQKYCCCRFDFVSHILKNCQVDGGFTVLFAYSTQKCQNCLGTTEEA